MYGVVLHAHPVRGESHNQRNTTRGCNTSNQISPNGKITPAVVFPRMPNRHFLKFWKWQKAVPILPHEAKALL